MTSPRAMALTVAGASKRFGNSLALDGVNLSVAEGTVCALVGANGSGKSTLIKALAGYHVLDAGVVRLHGVELNLDRMAEQGKASGLRFVHQDLALVPNLPIMDNLAMSRGYLVDALGSIDWRREEDRVRRQLSEVGVSAGPRELVASLGSVDRTLVAIVRALHHLESGRNILILDEPTARLPEAEASKLISRLRELKQRGLPIVYVTHRLDEVFRLADTVTVLRDGREAFSGELSTLTADDLRWLITGAAKIVSQPGRRDPKTSAISEGELALSLDDITSRRLRGVSLRLHRGEVLGVTGLVGSGKSELGRIVYGLQPRTRGELRIGGRRVNSRLSDARTSPRIGFIPQDRRSGLFPSLPVQENIIIAAVERLKAWYGLSRRRMLDAARHVIRSLRIQPADPSVPVNLLSGGNQQKVALGKWLQLPLEILILDEPTQAIDIGTKQELMTTIKRRARSEALAVLWLESDIGELIQHADRIVVMSAGRIGAEFAEPPFDLGQVLSEAYRVV